MGCMSFHNDLNADFILSTWYPTTVMLESKVYPTVQHFVTCIRFPWYKDLVKLNINDLHNWVTTYTSREISEWVHIKAIIMTCGLLLRNSASSLTSEVMGHYSTYLNLDSDEYWGLGYSKNGQNMLGKCMKDVHDIILSPALA